MILLLLNNLYPRNKADVLGQDIALDDLKNAPGLKDFYSYGNGFFSTETIPSNLIKALKKKQYDLVLVPVSNNHLEGFQNALEIAQIIEPKNISLVYPEGQIEPYENLPINA
ncbi:MAG: hypothetical protein CMH75_05760 [Nitrospina sp.]|nr:hypothetical protein [Nitrospina sp.]